MHVPLLMGRSKQSLGRSSLSLAPNFGTDHNGRIPYWMGSPYERNVHARQMVTNGGLPPHKPPRAQAVCRHFQSYIQGTTVNILTDNIATMYYVNGQGGALSQSFLCRGSPSLELVYSHQNHVNSVIITWHEQCSRVLPEQVFCTRSRVRSDIFLSIV